MTAEELRAITAAGPAVVMISREDMLKLLDDAEKLRRQNAALRLLIGGALIQAGRPA